MTGRDGLEARIADWRGFLERRDAVRAADVDELEAHLRDQIDGLGQAGLDDDEAFLIAVGRLGRLDELSREFAREHSERLWKQLVLDGASGPRLRDRRFVPAVVAAVGAALAIAIPTALGAGVAGDPAFLGRNLAVLVLPFLGVYFAWRGRVRASILIAPALALVVTALALNLFPFGDGSITEALAAAHAPVVLWLAAGLVFADGDWRSSRVRMDYLRFTGEWAVYFALLALGGGVLTGLTAGVFGAIGLDASGFITEWMLPCGAAAAVVVAAWLVEAKQSVIENIAPVLTKVFTPLTTALLAALAVAAVISGNPLESQRELLIIFDAVLVVVLALLLYSISAREPLAAPGWFDRLQLVMVVLALAVDVFVLVAMAGRIGVWGASPLKLASLGLNLLLAVNLVRAAWLQWRFVRGRVGFAALEDWQTGYLPAYAAWAAIVVLVFPLAFAWT